MRTLSDRRRLAGMTLLEIALLVSLGLGVALVIKAEPLVAISADARAETSRSAAASR